MIYAWIRFHTLLSVWQTPPPLANLFRDETTTTCAQKPNYNKLSLQWPTRFVLSAQGDINLVQVRRQTNAISCKNTVLWQNRISCHSQQLAFVSVFSPRLFLLLHRLCFLPIWSSKMLQIKSNPEQRELACCCAAENRPPRFRFEQNPSVISKSVLKDLVWKKKCSDITNTQVGISGETVPEGGNLCIYYVQKQHLVLWFEVWDWCVTPHSSPSRGCWQCLTIFNILNIFIIIN